MKYLLLSLLLILYGCGSNPPAPIPVPVFSPVVCDNFGRIEGVEALPVVFVKGIDNEGNTVLGLRGDMYSNLSIIIKDTLRYIREQKKAISYYEKCIADHNAKAQKEGDS